MTEWLRAFGIVEVIAAAAVAIMLLPRLHVAHCAAAAACP